MARHANINSERLDQTNSPFGLNLENPIPPHHQQLSNTDISNGYDIGTIRDGD